MRLLDEGLSKYRHTHIQADKRKKTIYSNFYMAEDGRYKNQLKHCR